MKTTNSKKAAFLLAGILVILCCISSIAILRHQTTASEKYDAFIYVNGELYETIPLHQVTSSYQLTITAEDGGYNTIGISPHTICIQSADCPDQICVKQGIIRNSLLPITCLPHGLVIELKPASTIDSETTPDIITH